MNGTLSNYAHDEDGWVEAGSEVASSVIDSGARSNRMVLTGQLHNLSKPLKTLLVQAGACSGSAVSRASASADAHRPARSTPAARDMIATRPATTQKDVFRDVAEAIPPITPGAARPLP